MRSAPDINAFDVQVYEKITSVTIWNGHHMDTIGTMCPSTLYNPRLFGNEVFNSPRE